MALLRCSVIALAGCSFARFPATSDAPSTTTADAASGAPIERTCHVGDPALRMCLDFEDRPLVPIARDGSTFTPHADAMTVDVVAMPRAGEQAVQLASDLSTIVIAPSAALQIASSFTVELWTAPSALPANGTFSDLFGTDADYSLTLDHAGHAGCWIDMFGVRGAPVPTDGSWHHVACTYDGTELRVYVDGNATGCATAGVQASAGTGAGWLGTSYLGGLDNARVYARALSEDEICARANVSGNCSGCPGGS